MVDLYRILAEKDLRYQQRFEAQERATSEAKISNDKIYATVMDLASAQIAHTGKFDLVADRIGAVAARLDKLEGRSIGAAASWGMLLGAVGLVGSLIAIFMR